MTFFCARWSCQDHFLRAMVLSRWPANASAVTTS